MDCSVLYATEYPVLWMKIGSDGKPIPLSKDSSLIIRDNRFALRYDTASATYTLQIKDVQRSDEARYECQIIVGINNKVAESVNLKVYEPPVIHDNSTRSVVVNAGEKAELECGATGSPKPSISWRRADNAILPTGGIIYKGKVLKIHQVKKEDRGTYFCVADNGVGEAARRNVALEVEFPPFIEGGGEKKKYSQKYGLAVQLDCSVEAYPQATVTWIHNGLRQISVNNENYLVSKGFGTDADGHTVSTLRIKSVNQDTVGEYTCRAQNKLEPLAEKFYDVMQGWESTCDGSYCYNGSTTRSVSITAFLFVIFAALRLR